MLCDEAGAWRTASVVRAVRPSEVVFDADGGEIALSVAKAADGGSVLTIRDDSARGRRGHRAVLVAPPRAHHGARPHRREAA